MSVFGVNVGVYTNKAQNTDTNILTRSLVAQKKLFALQTRVDFITVTLQDMHMDFVKYQTLIRTHDIVSRLKLQHASTLTS